VVLFHFRLTVPGDLSDEVWQLLVDSEHAINVTVQPGACVDPPGDLVEADVAREGAGVLLHELETTSLPDRGGVVILAPVGTPFAGAEQLEHASPGHPDDAVIWEAVEAKADAGAQPTVSFHLFLVFAVMLGAIAVITDSSVLVVGAMVVGPEFSAIAAVAAGIVLRHWSLAGRSLRLLFMSFALAIAVVLVLSLLARAAGIIDTDMVTAPRPNTGFIWRPDVWSLTVALIAGVVGALALALDKASTMVGVFISVTTVPAAGNLALGLAFGARSEIAGSAQQLGMNIAAMILAGILVLALMRKGWLGLMRWSERIPGWQPHHAPFRGTGPPSGAPTSDAP
jgi:uncharacterized hydrophobic protein (TIGR00271 family)